MLWCALKTLEPDARKIHCVIYTGDSASGEAILAKAKDRFGIDLSGMPIEFVRLSRRHWIEAKRYVEEEEEEEEEEFIVITFSVWREICVYTET